MHALDSYGARRRIEVTFPVQFRLLARILLVEIAVNHVRILVEGLFHQIPHIVRLHPVVRIDVDDVIALGLGKTGHARTRKPGIGLMEDLHAGYQIRELPGQYIFQ